MRKTSIEELTRAAQTWHMANGCSPPTVFYVAAEVLRVVRGNYLKTTLKDARIIRGS